MRQDFSSGRNVVPVTSVQSLSASGIPRERERERERERGNDVSPNADDRCEAGHQKHISPLLSHLTPPAACYRSDKHVGGNDIAL